MNTNTTTVETNCELPEFRITANTTVCVRSGRMLSAVPRRIEVHSSYHQLRKETHFSDFRTHAFPAVVKNWRAFFISHRPPLTQTGLSSMARSQSEYEISVILGAVQIHRRLLWEERPR